MPSPTWVVDRSRQTADREHHRDRLEVAALLSASGAADEVRASRDHPRRRQPPRPRSRTGGAGRLGRHERRV